MIKIIPIGTDEVINVLTDIYDKVWDYDIPSPTVPEYIEHHEQIQDILNYILKYIKMYESNLKVKGLSNPEWIDFLSKQFNVSRTSAKEMLHIMMSVKKEDNLKRQFSGRK